MTSNARTMKGILEEIEPNLPNRSLVIIDEGCVMVRAEQLEAAGFPALADVVRSIPFEGPFNHRAIRQAVTNGAPSLELDELDMDLAEGPLCRTVYLRERQIAVPKIFCWVNRGHKTDWQVVLAIAEDGMQLASHMSSSEHWAMRDIGVGTKCKHDKYREHYPNGYELVWVGEHESRPGQHAGLDAAIIKNSTLKNSEDK